VPDDQNTSHTYPFDAIRKADEQGGEYWSAGDLGKLLGYKTNYRNFQTSINNAKTACETSGQAISDHFAQVRKQIKGGKGAVQTVDDYELSRYACYLIVQNADAEKPIVAL